MKLRKEILSTTDLATTTALNGKRNKVTNKIPNITNLSITALLLLLLKIKYLMLVIQSKKTYYNTNISEIENKITTEHDLITVLLLKTLIS